jgi:hypothetical protein
MLQLDDCTRDALLPVKDTKSGAGMTQTQSELVRAVTSGQTTVKRVRNLSYRDFIERYLRPRVPVIIEDAIDHWPALTKWTPEFWIQHYGDRQVIIEGTTYRIDNLFTRLRESVGAEGSPYYRNVKIKHVYPELLPDIAPPVIYSQPNWFKSMWFEPFGKELLSYCKTELFIGGAGGEFPILHFDINTLVHQLVGNKLFLLFPPEATPYLYAKEGAQFNISRIKDLDRREQSAFPQFGQATRYEVMIGPGDTLLVPGGWWHSARMPGYSVSVAYNMLNDVNGADFTEFVHLKSQGALGRLSVLFMAYLRVALATLTMTSSVSRQMRSKR